MKILFAAVMTLVLAAAAEEVVLVQPKDLAAELAQSGKPFIIQVGPNVLYRSHHITAAMYAGPGSKQEGLDLLMKAVKDLPRDRQIVIYCGCCPWDRCPNIKPAFEALAKLGFTHVRALYIPTNFKTDWIDQRYPVEPQ